MNQKIKFLSFNKNSKIFFKISKKNLKFEKLSKKIKNFNKFKTSIIFQKFQKAFKK